MIVLPGPASQDLADRLAFQLKSRLIPVISKKFPDGENYIRIEGDLQNQDVIIVQTTSPPQDERLIQLFLLASAARDQEAKKITVVIPYFSYSRQDKVFLKGEAFSARIIVNLLKTCGVSRIITVDAHNPTTLSTFNVPIVDLSAISLLAQYFKDLGLSGAISLSMGKKGEGTAEEAAKILEGGFEYISTRRDRYTGEVSIEKKFLNVEGKVAIFFDDIISSGGTMAQAVAHAKQQGATKVYAACVHPLLIANAKKRILESGANEIVGTDTVPSRVSVVSVAPLIAKALSYGA
jgi:ribose-phosphate pyrophosphokinase